MHSSVLPWRSLRAQVMLATLTIFIVSLWGLSIFVSRMLHQDMERLSGEQQLSTTSFVAAAINEDLVARKVALEKIAREIRPVMASNTEDLQKFLEHSPLFDLLFNAGVVVTGINGISIASTLQAAERVGINYSDRDYFAAALKEEKVVIGKPVIGRPLNSPIFVMATRIQDAQGNVIGVLAGVTDLGKPNFLGKIAAGSYGKTGGYVLKAAQHRLVITATDQTRIMERLPAVGVNAWVDKFAEGYEGSVVAVNLKGEEMLVSGKGVPAAEWYVLASLPTEEAFAPIRDMQRHMLRITILLTVLMGGLTWWMLSRQLAPLSDASQVLSRMSMTGERFQPLPIVREDEVGQLIKAFNTLLATVKEREDSLHEAQRIAQVGSWQLDVVNNHVVVSEEQYRVLGLNTAEPTPDQHEHSKLYTPESWMRLIAALSQTVETGIPYDLELEVVVKPDSSQGCIWARGEVVRDTSGSIVGLRGTATDITERKEAEKSLTEAKALTEAVVENVPLMIFLKEAKDLKFVMFNRAGEELLGYARGSLLGKSDLDLFPPDQAVHFMARDREVLDGKVGSLDIPEEWVTTANHEQRLLHTRKVRIQSPDGTTKFLLGISEDITERKQAEEKLQLAAGVFSHAREGIMITAPDGAIIDVNDAFGRITGYSHDEVIGQNPRLLSSGRHGSDFYRAMWRALTDDGHWYGEIWNRRKNGEVYAEMQTISTVHDANGKPQQFVALFSDISAQKAYERQLEHVAHYDALTTLPNRQLLADRMRQAISQADRRGQHIAVAYLDLDGFKAINDQHEHEAGDQLLMTLACRMKGALRDGDTLARLGGDEFVAVLLDLANIEDCAPILTRLLSAAAMPVQFEGVLLQVSASLGVAFYPQAEKIDADQLLRQADQAMYQAKLAGKNRYHVFDAEQDRSVRGHHESQERIRLALEARQFVLYYQPKVNMRTGAVVGAEALIRWQHPEQGLLAPVTFLPVIDDNRLAVELGEWVIETALSQMEVWRAAGLELPVSVNIDARQLQQIDFVDRLRALLAQHPNLSPSQLELEVLETSALDDLARVSRLVESCRALGVHFSLDDFGTGYSSLAYLKHLRVAQLKVDQTFVRDMLEDPEDLAILEGVLGLAKAFHLEVIAEGVETLAHGELLLQLGCELAQGYGIARPMPADQIPAWSATWRPDSAWLNRRPVRRDDLPVLFAGVEHSAWIATLRQYLQGEGAAPTAFNVRQCRFGKWLDSDAVKLYAGLAPYVALGPLHQQIHALAAVLNEHYMSGDQATALAGLDDLHRLRDELLDLLQQLLESGMEHGR